MKTLWYLLTAFLGLVGLLSLLRTGELLLVGAGINPVQLFIAVIFSGLAIVCLRKARTTT